MNEPAADPSELVAFCRQLHPRLIGALSLHCGDRDVAEDVAQETLARVWQRWSTVQEMSRPDAWAYRVAFNLTASRFRRRAVERRVHERLQSRALDGGEPDGADRLVVRAAVAALPARQRAALVLRYFADLSVEETAVVMGCAEGTVKSLTHKAIVSIRTRLVPALAEEVSEHA